jgi:hypothetical protein
MRVAGFLILEAAMGLMSDLLRMKPAAQIFHSWARGDMAKEKKNGITWLDDIGDEDYQAAQSYLSLLYRAKKVEQAIAGLRQAPIVEHKSADILRASRLPLLDANDPNVKRQQKKCGNGEGIAPLLLLRDEQVGRLVIADGYHRMCAVVVMDANAPIKCKIV